MDQAKAKQAASLYQKIKRLKEAQRSLDQVILDSKGRCFVFEENTEECAAACAHLMAEDLAKQLPILEAELDYL